MKTTSSFGFMLAERELPEQDGEWIAEPKYDGARAMILSRPEGSRIVHRSGHERTNRYPELAELTSPKPAIMDGEIVVLNTKGIPEFNLVQQRQTDRKPLIDILIRTLPTTFYAFDILSLAGTRLTDKPLAERKKILHKQLDKHPSPHIRETPYVKLKHDQIRHLFKMLVGKGYEGIMLKRPDSTYQTGRSKDWIKMKATVSEDFYIIGYTRGSGWRTKYFGSLILAETPDGPPVCKVGTGFTNIILKMISEIVRRQATGETRRIDGEEVTLVKPTYKAEVEYLSGTKKNRFPSFKKLIQPEEGE